MLRKINIPFGVIVNRSDLGDKKTDEYCVRENIPILMRIPFSQKIAKAYSTGKTIVEANLEYKQKFQELFEQIKNREIK
jgi:MinD superfamily P-loop ATPase